MHSELKNQVVQFCADNGWHPLLAAQVLYEAGASLLISQLGPEEGIAQMDKLEANFKEEMKEEPQWNLH
jgi:hypothetical protein